MFLKLQKVKKHANLYKNTYTYFSFYEILMIKKRKINHASSIFAKDTNMQF